MGILARGVRRQLNVSIQCPHDADAREQLWPVMFGDEQQRLHRRLPILGVVSTSKKSP
jgi:hypothetical protein